MTFRRCAPLALGLMICSPALAQTEAPVDPYEVSNANAGASPLADGGKTFAAFNGSAGVGRIVDSMVDQSLADPRISEIFTAFDMVRLRRTLKEQVCYILGGPCDYSGRDMKTAHKDMGLQVTDLTLLIEHLQIAMEAEGVPFAAQNRLLAKLAPMKRIVVER